MSRWAIRNYPSFRLNGHQCNSHATAVISTAGRKPSCYNGSGVSDFKANARSAVAPPREALRDSAEFRRRALWAFRYLTGEFGLIPLRGWLHEERTTSPPNALKEGHPIARRLSHQATSRPGGPPSNTPQPLSKVRRRILGHHEYVRKAVSAATDMASFSYSTYSLRSVRAPRVKRYGDAR